jgi:hypothetical protein
MSHAKTIFISSRECLYGKGDFMITRIKYPIHAKESNILLSIVIRKINNTY